MLQHLRHFLIFAILSCGCADAHREEYTIAKRNGWYYDDIANRTFVDSEEVRPGCKNTWQFHPNGSVFATLWTRDADSPIEPDFGWRINSKGELLIDVSDPEKPLKWVLIRCEKDCFVVKCDDKEMSMTIDNLE